MGAKKRKDIIREVRSLQNEGVESSQKALELANLAAKAEKTLENLATGLTTEFDQAVNQSSQQAQDRINTEYKAATHESEQAFNRLEKKKKDFEAAISADQNDLSELNQLHKIAENQQVDSSYVQQAEKAKLEEIKFLSEQVKSIESTQAELIELTQKKGKGCHFVENPSNSHTLDTSQQIDQDVSSQNKIVESHFGEVASNDTVSTYIQKIYAGKSHLSSKDIEEAQRFINENQNYAIKRPEELAALRFYSGDGYKQINRYLRGIEPDEFKEKERELGWNYSDSVKDYEDHISFINNALSRLPNYSGKVFRGTPLEKRFLEQYKLGELVKEKAFLSSSISKEAAKSFASSSFSSKLLVFFIIDSKRGKKIADYAKYSYESEILFPNNTVFRVNNIEEPREGYVIIEMAEE